MFYQLKKIMIKCLSTEKNYVLIKLNFLFEFATNEKDFNYVTNNVGIYRIGQCKSLFIIQRNQRW